MIGRGITAPFYRRWAVGLSQAALLLCAPLVWAQTVDIYSSATTVVSTADRMISYRNQQHSWQTSDGAVHIMVNQGTLPTGNSLALYSSYDQGMTWNQMFALANTDQFSTSDGTLATMNGATLLLLTYATAQSTGTILYTSATYNPASQSWTLAAAPQTAYSVPGVAASNPAFAADSAGNYWCGFTVQNLATQQYEETVAYRAAKSNQWLQTGLVLKGPDTSLQHSARPVPYAGGVGMIYESGATMYWAYRLNGAPYTSPWTTSVLYNALPPYSEDPYDTHYSVVADSADDLHLTLIANQQLIYMRYLTSTGAWGPPRPLTTQTINAAYSQAAISGGNIVLMVNNQQSIEVFQSTNNGNSFTLTQALLHATPPPGSALYYGNPRVETPGRSTSPMPVWQQFVNGPIQGLMFFQVPIVN